MATLEANIHRKISKPLLSKFRSAMNRSCQSVLVDSDGSVHSSTHNVKTRVLADAGGLLRESTRSAESSAQGKVFQEASILKQASFGPADILHAEPPFVEEQVLHLLLQWR